LAVALALLAVSGTERYLGGFGSLGSGDFVEYWSAARLAMHGGNPYDPAALLAVERAAGWPRDDPLLMWNPPWTLALVMPVALLPFEVATFAWLLVQLGLLLTSGFFLWRYFAPQSKRYWVGLLVAACFIPAWIALSLGQISPWLLAGVVGFLWAGRRGWDLAAGAALALLTIKLHVTYLFFLAALWWAWRERRWRVFIGWGSALAAASVLVMIVNSGIFADYSAAAADPPLGWQTPTLGTWLRFLLGWELTWLQFVPSLVGGLGLLAWLWRRQGPWRWDVLAGPLLLASVVTAAFGWSFDQVVLLPAVVALIAALSVKPPGQRGVVFGALSASQVGLWALKHWNINDVYSVWHPWALAGLYWWVTAGTRSIWTDEKKPVAHEPSVSDGVHS
jgi:hypothetical protein